MNVLTQKKGGRAWCLAFLCAAFGKQELGLHTECESHTGGARVLHGEKGDIVDVSPASAARALLLDSSASIAGSVDGWTSRWGVDDEGPTELAVEGISMLFRKREQ